MIKTDEPRRRASDTVGSASSAEPSADQLLLSTQMRNANEKLVVAMVGADEEISKRQVTEEMLRDMVRDLQKTQDMLREKNDDLEEFADLTVDRELKMMEVEKRCETLTAENEALRKEISQLRGTGDNAP